MKKVTVPVLLLSVLMISGFMLQAQPEAKQKNVSYDCLNETEQELARQINEYRAEKGLPAVTLSASLSHVARVHCLDLEQTSSHSGRCNLHSWSDKGKWSSCCYTPDHKRAECMWNKPRELTSYTGDGFEIAYWTDAKFADAAATARDMLNGWKGSKPHNELIINKGIWKDVQWEAMGIGVSGGYATVWFGRETDPAGVPEMCK